MSDMIAWIAAEAERQGPKADTGFPWRRRKEAETDEVPVQELPAHQFGACSSPPVSRKARRMWSLPRRGQKVAQKVDACDEPP